MDFPIFLYKTKGVNEANSPLFTLHALKWITLILRFPLLKWNDNKGIHKNRKTGHSSELEANARNVIFPLFSSSLCHFGHSLLYGSYETSGNYCLTSIMRSFEAFKNRNSMTKSKLNWLPTCITLQPRKGR